MIKSESIVCGALDALGKLTEPLPSISSCDLANNIFALLNVVTQYMLKGSTRTYRALQSASIVIIHLLQGNKNNKINREYTEYIVVEAVQLR